MAIIRGIQQTRLRIDVCTAFVDIYNLLKINIIRTKIEMRQ